jgi:hypothetical protein
MCAVTACIYSCARSILDDHRRALFDRDWPSRCAVLYLPVTFPWLWFNLDHSLPAPAVCFVSMETPHRAQLLM